VPSTRSSGSSSRASKVLSTEAISSTYSPRTVLFEFIITVPDYPRQVVGRDNLIELYRGYGSTFFLDRCHDLSVHRSEATSTVVLEYASQGKVVATGGPYSNRYISVITLTDRKISHWRDYLDPLRVITALNAQH
jgi:ketosteroid isomerase-like protein